MEDLCGKAIRAANVRECATESYHLEPGPSSSGALSSMPESVPPSIGAFGSVSGHLIQLVARKVSLKYVALMVDWGLGFFMVPFNLGHLGQPLYGLWMLVASIPVYFSLLDLGYPAGVVKAAAHYRALGDSRTL